MPLSTSPADHKSSCPGAIEMKCDVDDFTGLNVIPNDMHLHCLPDFTEILHVNNYVPMIDDISAATRLLFSVCMANLWHAVGETSSELLKLLWIQLRN